MAIVELALLLPMLLLLTLGLVDLVVQMRTSYRVERMAAEILNAIAQLDPVTAAGIDAVLTAAPSIGGSGIVVTNTSGYDGAIHVTAIQRDSNSANQILWRVSKPTSPAAAVATRLNQTPPVLPGGVIAPSGVQLIAIEVASERVRWTSLVTQVLIGGAAPAVAYAIAVGRPRTATLPGILP